MIVTIIIGAVFIFATGVLIGRNLHTYRETSKHIANFRQRRRLALRRTDRHYFR